MPYFKKLALPGCNVAILPKDFPHCVQAKLHRYDKKEEYRISANYYNQRSFWFEITLTENNIRDSAKHLYVMDWIFFHGDQPVSFSKGMFNRALPFSPQLNIIKFYINVPSVTTVGEHKLCIIVTRDQETICNQKEIASFNVCDADLDERDRSLLRHGAIVGAGCAIAGAAIVWVFSNLSTIANWFSH